MGVFSKERCKQKLKSRVYMYIHIPVACSNDQGFYKAPYAFLHLREPFIVRTPIRSYCLRRLLA